MQIATRHYHDIDPKTGESFELQDRLLRTGERSFALMVAGELPGDLKSRSRSVSQAYLIGIGAVPSKSKELLYMAENKTVVLTATGPWKTTTYADSLIADAMYSRGKSFLASAVLLQRASGHEYVVLHLLCQGIELILKALLLFADYKKYKPILQNAYGHRIEKLGADVSLAYGLRPMRPALANELAELSAYFSKHLLRYAGIQDIFIAPCSIARDRVFRRIVAVLRLAEREIARRPGST